MESNEENFHAHLIIAVIATELGWYYFESVGPKPNLANNFWEINKRTLQIMISSFNNLTFDVRNEIYLSLLKKYFLNNILQYEEIISFKFSFVCSYSL